MNNYSMVLNAALEKNIITPEDIARFHNAGYPVPLFTYARWKQYGYTVKRGEKARLVVSLWKAKAGAAEDQEAPEAAAEKSGFFLKKCFLFYRDQVEKTEDAEARRSAEAEEDMEYYMKHRKAPAGPRDISDKLEMIRYYIMDCDLSLNKAAENMGLSAATIRRYIDAAEEMDRDLYFDVTSRIEKRKRDLERKARAKMYAA